MRAQDDTPKAEFNDMERYSRLAQFFSSPDKTLSELYPFSPYTSKIPLSECKLPDDEISLCSSDEDFSASDLSASQVSFGNESPIGRSILFDEPPSRLYLKRRPTRRGPQSAKEDSQNRSDGRQSDFNAAQWIVSTETRRGRAALVEDTEGMGVDADHERDRRPASRRGGSRESSRSSSQDGDAPDYSPRRIRKPKDGQNRGRRIRDKADVIGQSRDNQDQSSPERSSSEGTRKRRRSPERVESNVQPGNRHAIGSDGHQQSVAGRSNTPEVYQATASQGTRRQTPRSHRSPEHITETAPLRRIQSQPQKEQTSQQTKDASRGVERERSATGRCNQNAKKNLHETSSEVPQRETESHRRRNNTNRRTDCCHQSHDSSNGNKNEGVSSRPTSPRSSRRQADEQSGPLITETPEEHLDFNDGRRYRTSKFILPSSETIYPINLKRESPIKRASNATSSRAAQQRGHTGVAMNSPPDNSLRNVFCEAPRSSGQMPTKSPVVQTTTLPPKSSARQSSRSSGIPEVENPFEGMLGSPAGSSDTTSFFACTMSPFPSVQSSLNSLEDFTVFPLLASTPLYNQINKSSAYEEETGLPPVPERKSKIKTKTSPGEKSDRTRLLSPNHVEKQVYKTSCVKNDREKPVNEMAKFSREAESAIYSFDQSRSTATSTTPMNSEENIKIDDVKISEDISAKLSTRYPRSSCFNQESVFVSTGKWDRKFSKSSKENDSLLEPIRSLHRQSSLKSTSGSDVTEGESVLDIEKFKQAVRSVEVPPELLEPIESEDSENVINILETISESPLEDCSDVNNSSNYADDEHVSADDAVQSHESVNSAASHHARRDQLGDRSGSDLSDIQLHYAYGRNKNDQLELQWIKLEKVVDTASESSESSVIESPFNRQGEDLQDLQIRSMNLPNASSAQRHGDADRGPIATYLTLPTQSPATGEDPELAIIVLHEDNLSEHQKDVITRFRTGMKRRRSRSSSEMMTNVFGNPLSREHVDEPLIIPISDPSTDIGTATGFAVIADSEPEVPLSVDVDVKSWFAKQHTQKKPPILINKSPSRGLFNLPNPSYSESRIIDEYQKHETSGYAYDSSSPEYYASRQVSEEQQTEGASSVFHHRAHSSRRSTTKNKAAKDYASLERPKTAPPSSDSSKFRGVATYRDQTSSDINTSQVKRKTRKRTPESHSPPREHTRPSPTPDSTSKQTQLSVRKSKSPPPAKNTGNDSKSSDSGNKRATNKHDNTVKVLLEPKSKTWTSKADSKATQSFNSSRTSDKSKHTDSETTNGRHKRSSSTSSRRTDRSSSSHQSKSPERPKTAPAGSEKNRSESHRGPEPSKEQTSQTHEKRGHKRSLSAGTGDQGKGKDAEGRASTTTSQRATTAPSGGRKKSTGRDSQAPTRPQTAPAGSERSTGGDAKSPPPCHSCESTASTDSGGGGVPRYRLRRNINYLSEYRKTIDSLRAKCVMKDHMIDALLEELQRLAPSEETMKRLLVKLSNRKLDGPPPRRDYSCSEVADLLPRDHEAPGAAEAEAGAEAGEVAEFAPSEDCVCPTDFRIAGRVGCDCLLLTWKSAPKHETVAGYEVEVDGQLSQRVRSPTRTSALLMDLDLSREMSFSLRTLRTVGLPPCHPPLRILFAPSDDEWALDDPRPAN